MAEDILILGLGPAGSDLLTQESARLLRGAGRLILRTGRHPVAEELRAAGISFTTLDHLYQQSPGFDGLYAQLAEAVLQELAETGETPAGMSRSFVYAVPGHPLCGEESVRQLLDLAARTGRSVRVLPALSFVDVVVPALAALGEAPDMSQWQVADAAVTTRVWWDPARPTLVFQVDDVAAASRVKLALLEEYPAESPVYVVRRAGEPGWESVIRLPLYQLDRSEAGAYDHLTTVYVPPLPPAQKRAGFPELMDVVATLRSPEGCPWDREQNYASLRRYVLEEAYEVLEAIESEDPDRLCEELGDLLLQVALLSQLGREEGCFTIRDVTATIVEKLIRRHPHVFGDQTAATTEEVRRNWEAIKRAEKPERTSVLDGVPRELPALMKALEVSKRVVRVGFEWSSLDAVLQKLDEELEELRAELAERDPARLRSELGDLLFTVVNLARWLKTDPEEALREMIDRFSRRFREVERLASESGRPVSEAGIEELERLWQIAKRQAG